MNVVEIFGIVSGVCTALGLLIAACTLMIKWRKWRQGRAERGRAVPVAAETVQEVPGPQRRAVLEAAETVQELPGSQRGAVLEAPEAIQEVPSP